MIQGQVRCFPGAARAGGHGQGKGYRNGGWGSRAHLGWRSSRPAPSPEPGSCSLEKHCRGRRRADGAVWSLEKEVRAASLPHPHPSPFIRP